MAVHVEEILADTQSYLLARLPAALADVTATHSGFPLPCPTRENIFIGEPSRYRAYIAPCIFLVADSTNRVGAWTAREWAHTERQEHSVSLSLMFEQTNEDALTVTGFRYAEALSQCLEDADVTTAPATPRVWSTVVKIMRIDYGLSFVNQQQNQRTFRKDVSFNLKVQHWDLLTPRQ